MIKPPNPIPKPNPNPQVGTASDGLHRLPFHVSTALRTAFQEPETRELKLETRNSDRETVPGTRDPEPGTLNSKPEIPIPTGIRNPKLETRNLEPENRSPKPEARYPIPLHLKTEAKVGSARERRVAIQRQATVSVAWWSPPKGFAEDDLTRGVKFCLISTKESQPRIPRPPPPDHRDCCLMRENTGVPLS